jgi:hypothetical protein
MMSEEEIRKARAQLRSYLEVLDGDSVEARDLHIFINGLEAVLNE